MIKSSSIANRLLRNSSWNLSAYAVVVLIGVVSAPLYIKFLGLAHYGLFVLLGSVVAPFGLLSVTFGRATVKYIAEAMGAGKPHEAGFYLQTTLLFNAVVGLLGAATLIFVSPFLTTTFFKLDPADRKLAQVALAWAAGSWLLSQVSSTFASVANALQKYSVSSMAQSGFTILNLLTGIVFLWCGGGLLDLLKVRFGWAVVTVLFWVLACRRMLPGVSLWPRYHGWAFRRSLNFNAWYTVASVGGLLANQTDKLLLGVYLSTSAIGLFNVPNLIFGTGYNATTKVGEVLFPAFSHLQGRGEDGRLSMLLARSCWFLSVLMVGIQGSLFVFASDILRLYVGPGFSGAAVQVLRIFAFTAILSSPTVAVDQYLLGTARTQWTALVCIATGLLTLFVSLLLIPRFGLAGAAWSDLAAIVLSRPLIHCLIWRKHLSAHIGIAQFFGYAYGPPMIGMVLSGLACAAYVQLDWHPGWPGLIAGLMVAFALLSSLMVVLDVFPENKQRRKDLSRLVKTALQIVGLRSHQEPAV
jgi:O-antigen/teichoic acid export membrane protein